MEVNSGTSDAAIIDLLMAGAMIGEGTSYPDLKYTDKLTTEEYGVGCRKGSDLAAYINDEFAKFKSDGSFMEIATKYGVQDAWKKKLRDYFAEYLKRTLLTAAVSAAAVLWVQRFPVGNFGIFILDGLLYTAVFAGVIVLFYRGSEEYDTLRQRGLKILKRRAE